MQGNILVTVLICVFLFVVFLGFLSYCWYARHVRVGALLSKAMVPVQRRVGRERQRQGDRGQLDIERHAPLQVPRYTSRGWSRARTRSQPREETPRKPAYLIVEEAQPGERPRVTRYSPGRVAISFNDNRYQRQHDNGERRNPHRSKSCSDWRTESVDPWNKHGNLRPPEGVLTQEAIHKWAAKTHPNGSGWEAKSHGQKGEHPPSHHDDKAGSHRKESTWASSHKSDQNNNQPRNSTHSPKKTASNKDNKSSLGWPQASKKVSSQQSGIGNKISDRNSKNSDWGPQDNGSRHGNGADRNSKKSDNANRNSKQGNDPNPWGQID
ncbi:hypothetical protein N7486_009157 [Penicillium sp. IBT 16267x]|nr:hypothetical protein N7486_009157 [Penicillium sp. IBT 16267x]